MADSNHYDVAVIGSGFGGALTAHPLVAAGLRVVMLERGDRVPRGPHNWEADGSLDLTPFYSRETPYEIAPDGDRTASTLDRLVTGRTRVRTVGGYHCVGGPSVFYGAVSLRLREADFEPAAEISGDSGAGWPVRYADLEPWYTQAERLLGVAGEAGVDPTEPRRSAPYPHRLNELSATSRRVGAAARRLGMSPFRLPLAIDYEGEGGAPCIACTTCDTFACAIGAKNDIATRILPGLVDRGLELRPNTVVTRLVVAQERVAAIETVDRLSGDPATVTADHVVLSAGALASPHLLLASGLEGLNPAGDVVGRYLTRHANAIAFGLFPSPVNPRQEFHKQLGIHDFYFGVAADQPRGGAGRAPTGKLGGIQQLQTPPVGLVKSYLPPILRELVAALVVPRMTGLLVMAEDAPRRGNGLTVDPQRRDRFGLPRAIVRHRYGARDLAARDALLAQAKRVLREAGALATYSHYIHTFSHAAGTVRMGEDPRSAPLDEWCRFRGVANLRVVDASFIPAGGGLNPSLTIAANALRVGTHLLSGC